MWFFVGGGLILLGVIAFAALLALTISRASPTDDVVTVAAPGQPVAVNVEADQKRMLFVEQGQPAPACTMTDGGGEPVAVDTIGSDSASVSPGSTEWKGFATFTASTPQVGLTCPDAVTGQRIRAGAPLDAGFAASILATVVVPLLLVGAGGLVLLITLILWVIRPPRSA